jgi:hypothetical protein
MPLRFGHKGIVNAFYEIRLHLGWRFPFKRHDAPAVFGTGSFQAVNDYIRYFGVCQHIFSIPFSLFIDGDTLRKAGKKV